MHKMMKAELSQQTTLRNSVSFPTLKYVTRNFEDLI